MANSNRELKIGGISNSSLVSGKQKKQLRLKHPFVLVFMSLFIILFLDLLSQN